MIYLDNAATSHPKPNTVYKAVSEALKLGGSPGRGGYKEAIISSGILYECREQLSKLFNIPSPDRIAFTKNTTEAINMALKGILKGEGLVISHMEHNSVYRPSMKYYREGNEVLIVSADKDGFIDFTSLEDSILRTTKLVCINHVSNVCGSINDIRKANKIIHKKGALTMIDAAQSAGIIPIDVVKDEIDILAFPGHKGLLGPMGTGGLYIKEGIEIDTIIEGGTGSESESAYMPELMPDRLEYGTQNVIGIAGLLKGVEYVLENGEMIYDHEKNLTKRLLENLSLIRKVHIVGDKTIKNRVGVVSIYFDNKDVVEVSNLLSEEGICTRAGLHCAVLAHEALGTLNRGTLRISVGFNNTIEEIDTVCSKINKILNF